MRDYLVFRLYGAMASWGEIAVGESRHSAVLPSRSALLGLLAAALGIRRDDDGGQRALTSGYRIGVKAIATGLPLRDYHTVQAPKSQSRVVYYSRRDELFVSDRLGTLLSAREYRLDSLAVIAVEGGEGAPFPLERLRDALEWPVFPLYLGRKSCPLAVSLEPVCLSASSLREALDAARFESTVAGDGTVRYAWETGMEAGMKETLRAERHDQPLSRRRWQFEPRTEFLALISGEGA